MSHDPVTLALELRGAKWFPKVSDTCKHQSDHVEIAWAAAVAIARRGRLVGDLLEADDPILAVLTEAKEMEAGRGTKGVK